MALSEKNTSGKSEDLLERRIAPHLPPLGGYVQQSVGADPTRVP